MLFLSFLKLEGAFCDKSSNHLYRSSYPSGGHYAGHSLGDNRGSWSAMRTSVIGIQQFNMFGIPYVGADICGYYDNVTVELCLRWYQLGAFYPLMR